MKWKPTGETKNSATASFQRRRLGLWVGGQNISLLCKWARPTGRGYSWWNNLFYRCAVATQFLVSTVIVLLQVHPAPTGDGRLPLSTTTPTPILLRCAKGNVATNAICDKLDIFVLSVAWQISHVKAKRVATNRPALHYYFMGSGHATSLLMGTNINGHVEMEKKP